MESLSARWLKHCNHDLAAYLEELIGGEYLEDATKLEKLLDYKDDETVLKKLRQIKMTFKGRAERLSENDSECGDRPNAVLISSQAAP